MNRRSFFRKAGLTAGGALASTLAAPAIAQTNPPLRWRLTSGFPASLDTLYGASVVFAKAVAEMTDGNWQIQTFQNAEIVAQPNIVDAVGNATVEMAHTASYYYFGKDPTFAFGTAIPFGLNTRQLNAFWYYGGGIDLMNDFYKKFNILGLPGGNSGAQMGGWFRKEIRTVADLQGMKFRSGGFAGAVLAKLGVVAQNIPAADIYPSLERGTIDGAEWVGPYDDEKLGFYKIAPYYYYPGWWEGGATLHFFFNLDAWNKLPKAYQAIARSAAAMANMDMIAHYDQVNPAALRRLVQNGVQLRPFTQEVMEASFAAATKTYDEMSATNADFRRLYAATKAARNEGFLWQQLADGYFDQYMMAKQRAGAL